MSGATYRHVFFGEKHHPFFLPLLIHAERKVEYEDGGHVDSEVLAKTEDGSSKQPVCAVVLDYGLLLTSNFKASTKDGVCISI
jgi:hypothetical protein